MRLVIMGTGPFAVPTCQRLMRDGHDIALVVTRPVADPQAKKRPPRPVFQWATEASLPIYEPTSINDVSAIERLKEVEADLFFVCDYGQILSRDCLATSRIGGINLHGSLLPRHRGAAPVQWTLLRGDSQAGVTVIHMTPRLDAGPALISVATAVGQDETAAELEPRLAELGVEATVQAIEQLGNWDGQTPLGSRQTPELVTKAPRFAKSDGQLDFRLPADYLARLVRACQPWPGTFAEVECTDGKKVRMIVRSARGLPADTAAPGSIEVWPAERLPEDVPANWDQALAIATGVGYLLVGRLQPAGRREMSVSELLRGHPQIGNGHFLLPPEPLVALSN